LKKHFLKKNKFKFKKDKVQYTEKKSFLADKEIIFRSSGRAKVFNISHRLQVFVLAFFMAAFCWSGYNYYYYHASVRIISSKEKELGKTRDAYMDLMSDVATLQNNLKDVVAGMDEAGDGLEEIKNYKDKALVVEDKIKQITDSESWIDADKLEEQMTKKDALLQKELLQKENVNLRLKIGTLSSKLSDLQETVKGLENAEMAILDKISQLSGKEISGVKSSLKTINNSLKQQKKYFNPSVNVKQGKGGVFVPDESMKIENKQLLEKLSATFLQIDTLAAYKEAMRQVPLGKPVYRYQLSSNYGSRQDPFKLKIASHKGLDMRSALGSRVSAPAVGRVTFAGYHNNGYGNLVVIDHGNGFVTKYAHLNKIYVKKGEKVKYNQALGEVGHTGRATGNHLHYEVLYQNVNVNPLTFINISNINAS
jgi:murein DD-endopeptidase MepM/ murein hydrolase activator NlpD